ncbi:MAG: hypothetical protein JXR95_07365 [Deltaproteobacteria bacterium]|nr:hypothetical protein [Deltaproteobacteria bacterium]
MVRVLILTLLILPPGCGKDQDKSREIKKSKQTFSDVYNLKNAVNHLKVGKYNDSLLILQKIRTKHLNNPEYFNTLGMASRINSYIEKDPELRKSEIKSFRKALELSPDNPVYLLNLAVSLWETSQKKESCSLLEKFIRINPLHNEKSEILNRLKICHKKPEMEKSPEKGNRIVQSVKNKPTEMKSDDKTKNKDNNISTASKIINRKNISVSDMAAAKKIKNP